MARVVFLMSLWSWRDCRDEQEIAQYWIQCSFTRTAIFQLAVSQGCTFFRYAPKLVTAVSGILQVTILTFLFIIFSLWRELSLSGCDSSEWDKLQVTILTFLFIITFVTT